MTKRPLTTGTIFKNSMVALVENLVAKVGRLLPIFYGFTMHFTFRLSDFLTLRDLALTIFVCLYQEPHYVRCIKPNDVKAPRVFNEEIIEKQVNDFLSAFTKSLIKLYFMVFTFLGLTPWSSG